MDEENSGGITEQEVKRLISEELTKAKLEVTEKRLSTFVYVIAVVGIIIPLFLSFKTSDKVDSQLQTLRNEIGQYHQFLAGGLKTDSERTKDDMRTFERRIEGLSQQVDTRLEQSLQQIKQANSDMQAKFRELAGTLPRRPVLLCTYIGYSLEGQTIALDQEEIRFEVKNAGDAPATNITFQVYMDLDVPYSGQGPLEKLSRSDEPAFKFTYEMNVHEWLTPLSPQKSRSLVIYDARCPYEKPYTSPALLKIFCAESPPKIYKFSFTVNISK